MSAQNINLTAIADAIRTQEGTSAVIPANTFADRILTLLVGVQNPSVTLPAASTQEEQLARIAAAIRAKEGSTDEIQASEFPSRIAALEEQTPSRLPSGYTEVEYIHFDGLATSFVLSETVLCNKDRLFFKFFVDSETGSSLSRYLCLLNSSRGGTYYYLYFTYNGGSSYNYMINVTNSYKKTVTIPDKLLEIDIDFANGQYELNGVSLTGSSNSYTIGSYSRLIGCGTGSVKSAMGKFYQFTHYRDGEIIHDYVPCINPSGVAGLYDINNGVFIENTKTGATGITPGPAV